MCFLLLLSIHNSSYMWKIYTCRRSLYDCVSQRKCTESPSGTLFQGNITQQSAFHRYAISMLNISMKYWLSWNPITGGQSTSTSITPTKTALKQLLSCLQNEALIHVDKMKHLFICVCCNFVHKYIFSRNLLKCRIQSLAVHFRPHHLHGKLLSGFIKKC